MAVLCAALALVGCGQQQDGGTTIGLQAATDGLQSSVESGEPGTPVNMRQCPRAAPTESYPATCEIVDYLPSGSRVVVRCAMTSEHPPGLPGDSRIWFYVNEVDGPRPGYSGFVFSSYVRGAPDSPPGCTDALLRKYLFPAPPDFTIVGECSTAGGTLSSTSSGFTPWLAYSVNALYPDGRPYPVDIPAGTVNEAGQVSWSWPCAGDPPGIYYTEILDATTGSLLADAHFTIAPAPPATEPAPVLPAPVVQPPSAPTSMTDTSTLPTAAPAPEPPASPSSAPTFSAVQGTRGAGTFTNPHNASGPGQRVEPAQQVQVSCKVYDPYIESVNPDGYWYRLSSSPWDNQYYAAANTFLNGDSPGQPAGNNTDFTIPDC